MNIHKRAYTRPQLLRQQQLTQITANAKISGKIEDNPG